MKRDIPKVLLRKLSKLSILAFLAAALLAAGKGCALGAPLVAVGAAVAVLVYPGYLLTTLLFAPSELRLIERLSIALPLSLGIMTVPAVIALLVEMALGLYIGIFLAICLALSLVYIRRLETRPKIGLRQRWRGLTRDINLSLAIVLTMILVVVIPLVAYAPRGRDNFVFLGYIRQYLDLGKLVPSEPSLGTNYIGPRNSLDPSLLHLTFLARLSGCDPIPMLGRYLPPLLAIFSILAFYGFAKQVLGNANYALFATALQVAYYLGWDFPQLKFFSRIAENKMTAWLVILPPTLLLMLNFVSSKKRSYLIAFGIAIVGLSTYHAVVASLCLIASCSFVVLNLLIERRWETIQNSALLSIPAFISLLFPLLLFLRIQAAREDFLAIDPSLSPVTRKLLFLNVKSSHRLFFLSDEIYIAHPALLLQLPIVLAFLLIPLLIRYLRRDYGARFLFSNMVIPTLLIYNPLTASLLAKAISPWMLYRVVWLLPIVLTIAFFACRLIQRLQAWIVGRFRLREARDLSKVFGAVVLLVTLFLHWPDLRSLPSSLSRQDSQWKLPAGAMALCDAVRDTVEPGSIVMADLSISFFLPTCMQVHVVATPRTFNVFPPTRQEEALRRMNDVQRFFDSRLLDGSATEILRRYDVNYIVIDRPNRLSSQLNHLPSLFRKLHAHDSYELYQVLRENFTHPQIEANTYLSEGRWEEAEIAYLKLLEAEPGNMWALLGLGYLYELKGLGEKAIDQYEGAAGLEPRDPWPHFFLADLYESLGQPEKSARHRRKAVELLPETPADLPLFPTRDFRAESRRLIRLGNRYKNRGEKARAEDAYLKVIRQDMWDGRPHLKLGKLYLEEGRVEEALTQFQRALALERWNVSPYLALGDIYLALGAREEAIRYYSAAADADPGSSAPHMALGDLYSKEGKRGEAMAAYRQAISAEPQKEESYLRLGQAQMDRGSLEEALDTYLTAIEVNPNWSDVHVAMGDAYRARGDINRAIIEYRRALYLTPGESSIRTRLADVTNPEGP